jgi:hypothetical protein
MQAEGEGREGPERWHGGLLPPRSGGSFPPLLTGVEQGGGLGVLGSQGGGVGAKWESREGLGMLWPYIWRGE